MTDALAELRGHIGTRVEDTDMATLSPVKALIATFDRDDADPKPGDALPPGWQALYFPRLNRPAELGEDGLPLSTDVLPRMPLPRRMAAGATMRFHQPIRIGDALRRETTLTDITMKDGATGQLIFATVRYSIFTADGLCVEEERSSVFREAVPKGAANPAPKRQPAPDGTLWRRTVTPDPVLLFRFSALTFNPHRIHYDRIYAREAEGYPGLVVHGPLTATLLVDFARDNNPGRAMTGFRMRARAPLFDIAPFDLVGRPDADGNGCEVWALTPEGEVAMSAAASFA